MREILKPALVLLIITAISALCLGFVYEITKNPIAKAAEAEKAKAIASLLPQAAKFEKESQVPESGIKVGDVFLYEVLAAYDNADVKTGYVVTSACSGYAGPVGVLTAINLDGTVAGINIISSGETPGLGANATKESFTNQFINKSGTLTVTKQAKNDTDIEAITSATITTQAVTDNVNAALEFFRENIKVE